MAIAKKIFTRPHFTTAGRVVYDRKPHEFTEKDILRIFVKLVSREPLSAVKVYINLCLALLELTAKTVAQLTPTTFDDALYALVIKFLESLVGFLFRIMDDAWRRISSIFYSIVQDLSRFTDQPRS